MYVKRYVVWHTVECEPNDKIIVTGCGQVLSRLGCHIDNIQQTPACKKEGCK